jgi:gamma-glutamyltranspeptidase/glutathione hydrolase
MPMFRLILSLWLLILPSAALASGGMVTAADPRGAAAGQEILRKGGSATDAAMAMMLALGVVEPQSSGIGGGGFLVHHDAKTGKVATIDGREAAPADALPTRFLDATGRPRPMSQVRPGGYSVGIPGNIRLMEMAHKKWGKLPWAALFQPAIRLAEQGFELTPRLYASLTNTQRTWQNFPEMQKLYWKDGAPMPVGSIVKNPALAATLRAIAAGGPNAFYTGANAAAISKAIAEAPNNPTQLTAADLAGYRAKDRPPVCGGYRGYKVCGMGPPSSGATTVLEVLGMLERFDLKGLGKDSPTAWHLIGEAMQLAYADREKYLGDPDFVSNPVAGMISPAYLASRSAIIAPDKTLAAYTAGTPPGAEARTAGISSEVAGTTHFIAIDGKGDIVAMTSTVEGAFGSQLTAGGFILNNELTDFTFVPERGGAPVANRVQPGKRPLSSMAPTIVYDAGGKPVFVVGAAGGKTIIMQVAKAIIAHLDWGLSAQDSIAMPLLYFNQNGLVIEDGTPLEAMKPALEQLGHKVITGRMPLKANAAERLPNGTWGGAADPRSPGVALAE